MADSGRALHKAVLAELESALSVSVYDGVPQGSAYPYVTLDTVSVAQEDYLNDRMERRTQTLTVWSTKKGQSEVLGILSDIEDALHRKKLTLDTGRVAGSYVTRKATFRDADGETFQGQIIFEFLIEL